MSNNEELIFAENLNATLYLQACCVVVCLEYQYFRMENKSINRFKFLLCNLSFYVNEWRVYVLYVL